MFHSIAAVAFLVILALVLVLAVYLFSGLFGPRVEDPIPQNVEEPTEEEFNSEE